MFTDLQMDADGYVKHPRFDQLSMQRKGNFVTVRHAFLSGQQYSTLGFTREIYDCDIFENDENWRLINIQVVNVDSAIGLDYVFESTVNRLKEPTGIRGWSSRSLDVDSGIDYMFFTGPDTAKAIVALNHISQRDFRYFASRNDVKEIYDVRYEYAVFRNDESIEFNVRPTASGAKAVTVLYLGKRVDQL